MHKTGYDGGMTMIDISPLCAAFTGAVQRACLWVISAAVLALMLVAGPLLAGQGTAQAAAGPWQGSDVFSARLISAVDTLGPQTALAAGLEVKLAKGWKIYWRSPGDAGLPPELEFSASGVVLDHQLDFPAPKRFSILGFDSFGYADHVIYPLRLTLAPGRRDVVVAGVLTGLVCNTVCIPIEETLTLSLPRRGDAPPVVAAEARDLAVYSARVPRPGTLSGVTVTRFTLTPQGVELGFAQGGERLRFTSGDVMVEAPSGYSFSAPEIKGEGILLTATGKPAADLLGQTLPLTVVTPTWLLDTRAELTAAPSRVPPERMSSALKALLAMMAAGFVGGVVLNIMPCVLPVISLKLASIITMGGAERGAVRRSFLMTAAGVVTSFLLLGAGLALVREAGVAIGWGIQFQDPIFLTMAAVAIAGFGVVMLDVVTVPVPAFIARAGGGQGLWGDFLSGFMATVLATPCSAPFVGTALTFAFTTSTPAMMAIFLAMGLGLALPWLMIASFPQLAGHLPKPGPWLAVVKRVLALGLFATSIWLLSILLASGDARGGDGWQAWRPGLAEELAQRGQVVVVDVTADWCLTCKANKALVLDRAEMVAAFRDHEAVLLRADWTKPDAAISAYLASHDRFGIPFNIIHGPGRPDGVVLPELLSIEGVKAALATASRR